MRKLICLAVALLFLGGCNYHELGSMDIVTGLSVDSGGVTALIADQKGNIAVKAQKKTIAEAVSYLATSREGELYFWHMQEICISENVAEQGLKETLDYLKRQGQIRLNMPMIICKTEGHPTILDGVALAKTVAESAKNGLTPATPLYKLLSDIVAPGIEAVLPVMEGIEIAGAAVLKGDSLGCFIPAELTYCLLAARNQVQNPVVSAENSAFEIESIASKISPKVKNGKLQCDISLEIKARVIAWQDGVLMNKENRRVAEKLCADRVTTQMLQMVEILKESGCDGIGVGQQLYRRQPEQWKKMENNWEDFFAAGDFMVKANVTLVDGGRVIEGVEADE